VASPGAGSDDLTTLREFLLSHEVGERNATSVAFIWNQIPEIDGILPAEFR